jgi:hypothetical protein
MESVGILLVRDGGIEVGAAAEPAPGGGQEARVHVHGGDVRVGHVGNEADAGGEKAGIILGAGDRTREFLAEAAADGRDVDTDLLEHAPMHHRHRAAAASRAVPLRAHKAAGGQRSGIRAGKVVLDCLESRAYAVA